ncbi:MAG: hypothetical protein LBQ22_02770 [Bacteroidales bacterium]|jgi:hypothetical protein|nr:hypothetical protein [Bacteroidales bacterium]
MKIRILLLIISFVFAFGFVYSQTENDGKLDKQVLIIYNEYSPVLKDANRIQFLPVVIDTAKIETKFEYNARPTMYKTEYTPNQINVATVKGESLRPLDNGMVKLGFGNKLTPYAEGFYNIRRNKNYSAGVHAKHISSHGKTKNSQDQKIYNGYANSFINAFGKKFMPASTISGDIGFSSNIVNFYGYDPIWALNENIFAPRDRSEMESINYMRLKFKAGIISNNLDKYKFDYNANLSYQYFFTSEKDNQHKIIADADLNKAFKIHRVGMDAKLTFNNNKINTLEKYNETFLDLNPYYKLYAKKWQVRLGLNTTGEFRTDSVRYHFYPNVYIQHNISDVLIPYASFKGYIENNDLEHTSLINPFINRINNYQTTNYAQVIDIGLKGNISKNWYFRINANYSKIDDMIFFINNYFPADLNNKFTAIYANVERFSGYGEITLRDWKNFSFTLDGHYYYYHYVKDQEKPWNMPNFDIGLRTNYKFNEKLNFGLNFDFIGARYALELPFDRIVNNPIIKKLKPIVDISLYGEYSFASNFDCFLHLNNITGQKQYYWNNYQSLGFNFIVGIKYLF